MKFRCNWLQSSLGVLAVLLITAVQNAGGYQYDVTNTLYEDEYGTPTFHTSTKWQEGIASGNATANGGSCAIETYTEAGSSNSAYAVAYGYGQGRKMWVWDGPPGTAPGGSLYWSHTGHGYVSIRGDRDIGDGDTSCYAFAVTLSGAASQAGSVLSRLAPTLFGAVSNATLAYGYLHKNISPEEPEPWNYFSVSPPDDDWPEEEYNAGFHDGWFEVGIIWNIYDSAATGIPSGTAQFVFDCLAYCDGCSSADASGATKTWSNIGGSAQADSSAFFASN